MILGLRVYLVSLASYLADEGTVVCGVDGAGECGSVDPVSLGWGRASKLTMLSFPQG